MDLQGEKMVRGFCQNSGEAYTKYKDMGFVEWDFTSLLGQFCVLDTVALLFPPLQSKAKLIVDLDHWLPAGKKFEENMIIVISKEGKVSRGWWEPRIESAILTVLSLTADKTLAVP